MSNDLVKTINLFCTYNEIPEQVDLNSKPTNISLLQDKWGKQYWFYSANEQELLDGDLLANAERLLAIAQEEITKAKSIDSYLVISCPVSAKNEEVLKAVISIEENKFYYKKYVMYFTEQEYSEFMNWYEALESQAKQRVDLEYLLSCDEVSSGSGKEPAIDFFLRLLIKVPFLPLKFPSVDIGDIERTLKDELNEDSYTKYREIRELLSSSTEEIKSLADKYFDSLVGEDDGL